MRFDFATAARILFAPGAIAELPALVREYGKRGLLVTGSNASRAEPIIAALRSNGTDVKQFSIPTEPTLDLVRAGVQQARGCEFVIGFGGGSAIDAAKAIAALTPNSGEPL